MVGVPRTVTLHLRPPVTAMLFDPARHEPLHDIRWDAARARDTVRAIVADTEDALLPDGTWPWHPLDAEGPPEPRHKSLYLGAAGVLWALWYLARVGAATLRVDPSQWIGPVYDAYLAEPDTGKVVPSYFLGEAGILLVDFRLTGSRDAADRLAAVVRSNVANPTNEALWGAPGTMIGALHMLGWTGEPRWRELCADDVESLWREWKACENPRCHLWTQCLYGRREPLLGAAHGFAGNAYALLRGIAFLSDARRATLIDRCTATLHATGVFEDGGANWPPDAVPARTDKPKMLVQWCHGAPGMITALADIAPARSPQLDAMLIGAGATAWRAGPVAKGPGICHGTAGNGYAFLALHRRSGDPIWLERARAFAMHAIAQYERARQRYGAGRYTLWTGDLGLAVYLWHCLAGSGSMPSLDTLD